MPLCLTSATGSQSAPFLLPPAGVQLWWQFALTTKDQRAALVSRVVMPRGNGETRGAAVVTASP